MTPINSSPFLSRLIKFSIFVIFLLALGFSFNAVEFNFYSLYKNRENFGTMVLELWPPKWHIFPRVLEQTVNTIQLALVSTFLAFFLSIPFGFLGATNVMKTKVQKVLSTVTRFSLNANRAVDTIIIASFFVAAVGLGPFPGTLALTIHSVGMLGKLFFETVEGVDKGPIEALEAAGASRLQVLRWAIWPQVLPYFISHTLFRFELNIRSAVVLGYVGAGGIGFLLNEYLKLLDYSSASIILLTILALVMSIDTLSGYARRKLL
jgi:phosphonate transport system permease protein